MKGDPTNPADRLAIAFADLARARRDLAASDPAAATFWMQQAAEKALKGWLIGQGWQLIKTHDLGRLLEECRLRSLDLSARTPAMLRLSRLYFLDRYVDDSGENEPNLAEAARLLSEIEQLVAILFPGTHE